MHRKTSRADTKGWFTLRSGSPPPISDVEDRQMRLSLALASNQPQKRRTVMEWLAVASGILSVIVFSTIASSGCKFDTSTRLVQNRTGLSIPDHLHQPPPSQSRARGAPARRRFLRPNRIGIQALVRRLQEGRARLLEPRQGVHVSFC